MKANYFLVGEMARAFAATVRRIYEEGHTIGTHSDASVCIVDETGKIIREVKVASVNTYRYHFKRIGLEAGPLSQWLFSALAEADLPVICVETRHMRAVLKAQINKTDRNDARGIPR